MVTPTGLEPVPRTTIVAREADLGCCNPIVHLAGGSIERLAEAVALANTDYRDVLWRAEYECGEKRLRDFGKRF